MTAARPDVTRLAPSPTGALHLGNARTFLLTWAAARRAGWRVVLRVEDLDGPRVKRGADRAAVDDLAWLGVDWDYGPSYQSNRGDAYRAAVEQLLSAGLAYPCVCTRKEVERAASAPHADDGSAVYPGTCRGRFATVAEARQAAAGREPAIRFRVPDDGSAIISWDDTVRGRQSLDARALGDFVIAKADGTAAYQLAVVVDDAAAGVTRVVRGDDLVDSTPRQVLLYHALGLAAAIPQYAHLPLVVGPDGRRLAKRHGDTRVSFYRNHGVPAGRVRALVAKWSGVELPDDAPPAAFVNRVSLEGVPPGPVTFTAEDDAWLRRVGFTPPRPGE
ncbi:MAG TPA: tRNA glutamyl-Q(34) synthetase GluQRS [Humisphaera sp.]